MRIEKQNTRLVLWDAATDWEFSYKAWNGSVGLKPIDSDKTGLAINLSSLPVFYHQNQADSSYAFKFFFKDKIKGRYNELDRKKQVVIKLNNHAEKAQPVEIGFIDRNGSVKTGKAQVGAADQLVRIPLDTFTDGSYLVIPHPYPDFVPYRVNSNLKPIEWNALEMLQFEIKPVPCR
jgi:hypothetical protein